MKKRYAVLIAAVAFLLGTMAGGVNIAGAENPIWLYVNGKSIPDTIMVNGRVYVPIRAVAETMGASVGWDQRTNTAYVASQRDALTEIEIVGPPEFQRAMRDGLELLKAKAPEEYKLCGKYIRRIEINKNYESRTGTFGHDMIMYIQPDYKPDPYWWASAIAHEATHTKQIYEAKIMTQEEEELEATDVSMSVLRKTGAPKRTIDYLQKELEAKWWEKSPMKN